eukprot:TRINITY_DN12963_c2_g1_i1.p2 TRINITY_DN12963_c2_g1~~TRINITY_DN12963_c2_g1_i1.p2  ORF type:complete len:117 (+),score=23.09 TRINITY_DN12963_c2_g1_i1:346-696(+)
MHPQTLKIPRNPTSSVPTVSPPRTVQSSMAVSSSTARPKPQNSSLQSLFQVMLISKTGFPHTSPPPNPPPLRPSSPLLAASLPSPAASATSSTSTAPGSLSLMLSICDLGMNFSYL